MRPIPFTVVGGFLGAGKTTLLNRLLRDNNGVRYAVLVNDFGRLNIDARLITDHGGRTLALANGCICCSLADGLTDALLDLLERPDPCDHILVEASGVADPGKIADFARLDPVLTLDGILVLADTETLPTQLADSLIGDTVSRQLAAADIIILNKCDLAEPPRQAEARGACGRLAPNAVQLAASHADLPGELLFGGPVAGRGRSEPERAGPSAEATFGTVTVEADALFDRDAFGRAMAALPATIIRAKGFVRFADAPDQPVLWQRCGARQELSRWSGERGPSVNALVFIGLPGMPDEPELARLLSAAQAR